MKSKLPLIARLMLGFVFFAAGLTGLLKLVPVPPDLPEALETFNTGLAASVYFMPFLKSVETLCGFLLLTGIFVPLVLVILAPIIIHIFLVHAFLAHEGLVLAVILGLLMIYLAFFSEPYSPKIKALFKMR